MPSQPNEQIREGHISGDEERDFLAAIARDGYKPVSLLTEEARKVYREAARATHQVAVERLTAGLGEQRLLPGAAPRDMRVDTDR